MSTRNTWSPLFCGITHLRRSTYQADVIAFPTFVIGLVLNLHSITPFTAIFEARFESIPAAQAACAAFISRMLGEVVEHA